MSGAGSVIATRNQQGALPDPFLHESDVSIRPFHGQAVLEFVSAVAIGKSPAVKRRQPPVIWKRQVQHRVRPGGPPQRLTSAQPVTRNKPMVIGI
jgi:hypothetical protein